MTEQQYEHPAPRYPTTGIEDVPVAIRSGGGGKLVMAVPVKREVRPLPTRDQITDVVYNSNGMGIESDREDAESIADVVLALLQKGTDR